MPGSYPALFRQMYLPRMLSACAGFLLAVLWMDMMFDSLVLAKDPRTGAIAENALASIAAYYGRVTGGADPMQHLVAFIMGVTSLGSVYQALRSSAPMWMRLTSPCLAVGAIGLSLLRILPDAVRLAARTDILEIQSQLAHRIFYCHIFCFVAVSLFVLLQVCWRERRQTVGSQSRASFSNGLAHERS